MCTFLQIFFKSYNSFRNNHFIYRVFHQWRSARLRLRINIFLGLEIYKVSQKSVGHQTCFFLWNTLYLTTDLEGSVKMRLSLFDVLFAWNLPFLRYLVNFSISQNTTQLGHEWIWSNKILAVDTRIKEVNIGIIIFI